VTDLDCLPDGIADDGTFVGAVRTRPPTVSYQPFVADVSGVRPFSSPDVSLPLRDISGSGRIVGEWIFPVGMTVARVATSFSSTGTPSSLEAPTMGVSSTASTVSNSGTAAGTRDGFAYAWPGGSLPGFGTGASAALISNDLEIAGTARDATISRTLNVVWRGGVMTILADSFGYNLIDMNAGGEIIMQNGRLSMILLRARAYGYDPGRLNLEFLARAHGWTGDILVPRAINDAGLIVGGQSPGWLIDMSACAP